MSLLSQAVAYLRVWRVPVVFQAPDGAAPYPWGEYSRRLPGERELAELYSRALRHGGALGLAVATGPWQASSDAPHVVVDVDRPPRDRESAMRSLAREGLVVVETRRGFHVHARVRGWRPYALALKRRRGDGWEHVGEGAALMPHLWTVPPSARVYDDGSRFRYRFVLPGGGRAGPEAVARGELAPPTLSREEFEELVSLYASATLSEASPRGPAPRGLPEEGGPLKTPLFRSVAELVASAPGGLLPRCVSWVLEAYAMERGVQWLFEELAALPHGEELARRVPVGGRFVVAAAFALFLAHTVENVTFEDITEFLSAALEAWPDDEGAPMDRKLSYLLLSDPEGAVYPRYAGLGPLSPAQVHPWLCEKCLLWRECGGRSPWGAYRRMLGWLGLSRL